jgi:hypothetical protein
MSRCLFKSWYIFCISVINGVYNKTWNDFNKTYTTGVQIWIPAFAGITEEKREF